MKLPLLACISAAARVPAVLKLPAPPLRTGVVLAQMGAPQLPHGWVAHRDEQTGQIYYCYENGHCQWEFPEQHGGVMSAPDEETAAYIAQKLQEPQIRIPRAVIEFLGTATALELLAQTEQVQAAGGMVVPETGNFRTNGGVYYQLLRGATHLPRDAQEAALHRIKVSGRKVRSWEKGQASAPGW
ncbi:hypothetical protein EMIHUDRAFT_350717 [Emiliania huxleyi CCMP1516]|uniref:Phosphorylated adapter RNA export protein n=2 Tax=Emiliania huxleyi TaxID=2903 RepID=A0A0D3IEG8_EMIH1|nr:hypothetical protein EMIHUDRAFT_350717 [Emiliania huxleyi CCMP1516]EOD09653.1 hypothetical protein EMIHUDRAFT_350717 [Emiliania huxleyi CCMP1516]|eukprot:XP_005762082.1 hypothetical protein EMIHUDRAFT_350717 [Emiliania huxleyi CCMP1516]